MHVLSLAGVVFAVAERPRGVRPARLDPESSDADLVERAQGGDVWATEAIYRRHGPGVLRLAQRMLARRDEAEDVLQDTFVLVLRDLPALRDGGALAAWVLRIAVRQALRKLGHRRFLRALHLDGAVEDARLVDLVDDAAPPDVHAALREIDRVLAKAPPKARCAWVLRRVEGYQLEEVAVACRCSLATAKRWISHVEHRVQRRVVVRDAEERP